MASVIILIISAILFVYWFRYSCLLVIGARTVRDFRRDVADANNLSFLTARDAISDIEVHAYSALLQSLDRDYDILVYLLRHTVRSEPVDLDFDQWLLRLDYKIMSLWCRLAALYSQTAAQRAVLEMTSVLGQLANRMGERTASMQ